MRSPPPPDALVTASYLQTTARRMPHAHPSASWRRWNFGRHADSTKRGLASLLGGGCAAPGDRLRGLPGERQYSNRRGPRCARLFGTKNRSSLLTSSVAPFAISRDTGLLEIGLASRVALPPARSVRRGRDQACAHRASVIASVSPSTLSRIGREPRDQSDDSDATSRGGVPWHRISTKETDPTRFARGTSARQ